MPSAAYLSTGSAPSMPMTVESNLRLADDVNGFTLFRLLGDTSATEISALVNTSSKTAIKVFLFVLSIVDGRLRVEMGNDVMMDGYST